MGLLLQKIYKLSHSIISVMAEAINIQFSENGNHLETLSGRKYPKTKKKAKRMTSIKKNVLMDHVMAETIIKIK